MVPSVSPSGTPMASPVDPPPETAPSQSSRTHPCSESSTFTGFSPPCKKCSQTQKAVSVIHLSEKTCVRNERTVNLAGESFSKAKYAPFAVLDQSMCNQSSLLLSLNFCTVEDDDSDQSDPAAIQQADAEDSIDSGKGKSRLTTVAKPKGKKSIKKKSASKIPEHQGSDLHKWQTNGTSLSFP